MWQQNGCRDHRKSCIPFQLLPTQKGKRSYRRDTKESEGEATSLLLMLINKKLQRGVEWSGVAQFARLWKQMHSTCLLTSHLEPEAAAYWAFSQRPSQWVMVGDWTHLWQQQWIIMQMVHFLCHQSIKKVWIWWYSAVSIHFHLGAFAGCL